MPPMRRRRNAKLKGKRSSNTTFFQIIRPRIAVTPVSLIGGGAVVVSFDIAAGGRSGISPALAAARD